MDRPTCILCCIAYIIVVNNDIFTYRPTCTYMCIGHVRANYIQLLPSSKAYIYILYIHVYI